TDLEHQVGALLMIITQAAFPRTLVTARQFRPLVQGGHRTAAEGAEAHARDVDQGGGAVGFGPAAPFAEDLGAGDDRVGVDAFPDEIAVAVGYGGVLDEDKTLL